MLSLLGYSMIALTGIGSPSAGPAVTGRAGFTIRHDDHSDGSRMSGGVGTASVNFNVVGGASPSGILRYAAEDHGNARYPHIVVRMTTIQSLTIEGQTARVVGQGEFHDEPASMEAIIVDGGPRGRGDRFTIRVKQGDLVVYERMGNIEVGDLAVNP
jgi:hypothetical protein